MLLSCGKVIFFNEKSKATDFFSDIGYKCPELSNPADYFMSMMSIESIEKLEVNAINPDDMDEVDRLI
jgi:hypothetical protein